MNFTDLVKEFSRQTDIDEDVTAGLMSAFIRLIAEKLQEGHAVRIRGFGAFHWKTRKARSIQHPTTGKHQDLPEREVLHFTASRSIRRRP